MPIRFRCTYCNRLLGIATRKAGSQTRCPHCGREITVPTPADEAKTERITFDDVEQMLGRGVTEVLAGSAVAAPATPSAPGGDQPHPDPHRTPETPPPKRAHTGSPPGAAAAALQAHPVAPAVQKEAGKPTHSEERPLFEGDVDEILGTPIPPADPDRAKPAAISGMDALSLGEPTRHLVLSAQTATLLMVAVVVLMAIAFAAGYFFAPKG